MSNVVVPQLGESVNEARVARWLKHEGDHVETGEALVELETDKIDLEVGADHAGVPRASSTAKVTMWSAKCSRWLKTALKRRARVQKQRPDPKNATPTDAGPRPVSPPKSAATLTPTNADAAPSQTKATASPNPPRAAAESRRATPTALKIAREHDVDVGPPPSQRLRQPRTDARNAFECRSVGRPLPAGSSRRSAQPRCSPPSTKWT